MLKTPSVMMMARRKCPSFALITSSKDATSQCSYGMILAPDRRQPSMMLAWFNRSEKMTSSFPTRAGMVAVLAWNPDWNESAASTALNFAILFSNSICKSLVPDMTRTAPGPTPYLSIAFLAASTRRGWLASPR